MLGVAHGRYTTKYNPSTKEQQLPRLVQESGTVSGLQFLDDGVEIGILLIIGGSSADII